jgi:thiamine pyrophosphokinase
MARIRVFVLISCFLYETLCCSPWTIVANGSPFPVNELQENFKNRNVLALDGAVNRLKLLQFRPDCILGDFDSVEDPFYWGISALFSEIDENNLPYTGNFGITIIPAKDQNYTDLEKGIIYCDAAGASSILIVQATGGRMDHTLGNLEVLKKYHRPERDLIIITEKEQIFYLCNSDIVVEGGLGEHCAILGYPQALMTTSGLAYNGSEYLLQLGIQESICNTIASPEATISIQGEALVILPKSCTFKKLTITSGIVLI